MLVVCAPVAKSADRPAATLDTSLPFITAKSASKLIMIKAKPDYPTIAKLNYIQGSVRVHLAVTEEGTLFGPQSHAGSFGFCPAAQ